MMLVRLSCIPLVLLLSCTQSPTPAPQPQPPDWYVQQSLAPPGEGWLIGYGDATDPAGAKQKALADISSTLSVQIQSEYRQRESATKGSTGKILDYASESDSTIRLRSAALLRETTKMEREFRGGRYYAAYAFDNRPLLTRLAEVLPSLAALTAQSPPPVAHFPLAQSLIDRGYDPKSLQLRYGEDAWSLISGNRAFVLSPVDWREGMFAERTSPLLTLAVQPQTTLKHGDLYHLTAKVEQGGYATLFSIFADGRSLRLGAANQKIQSGETLTFPDLQEYAGLEAENQSQKHTERDMLLAVLCPRPVAQFAAVAEITENTAATDHALLYGYGRVLEGLQGCAWTSRFVYIAPQ